MLRDFHFEQSDTEIITPVAGLTAVGHALHEMARLSALADADGVLHGGASHSDILSAYTGLLVQGKSDFQAIASMQGDEFVQAALRIGKVASPERLRQRMQRYALEYMRVVDRANQRFLNHRQITFGALDTGHVPLDIDAFPMDNSNTKKGGVGYTYKGFDGYLGLPAYLGTQGWCVHLELREGQRHTNADFDVFLPDVLDKAKALVGKQSVLVRLDSGHDAKANRQLCRQAGVDFLIKYNPRGLNETRLLEEIAARVAEGELAWQDGGREGKRVLTYSESIKDPKAKEQPPTRRVMRIIERTVSANGQRYLIPDYTIEGWWCSLDDTNISDEQVIALYADHARCEQFHSEIKADLDVERLPSGRIEVNDLVMRCTALAYNILRWLGENTLHRGNSPRRRAAKRRRLRTVMQDMLYQAARVIHHARRKILRFGCHSPGFAAFRDFRQELLNPAPG